MCFWKKKKAKEETKKESVKKEEPKTEEPKKEAVKEEKEKTETVVTEKTSNASNVYHITKRSSDEKWQVKFSKSTKAIKLFNTQQEAIDYAKSLSKSQDHGFVIHKKTGTVRKKKY